MAINGVGRPSPLEDMLKPDMTAEILEKVESGCSDIEIYKKLHCSASTFRKWRDANLEAYDKAKEMSRKNMLSLAESALAAKLQVRELKETEISYDENGNVKSTKVKTKEYDVDTVAAMFVAKAANPELWNRSEYQRLLIDGDKGNKIKEAIDSLLDYKLDKYEAPEVEVPEGFD